MTPSWFAGCERSILVGLSIPVAAARAEGHPMKRVVTFLLAAGLVCAVASAAMAAPPSSDPTTDAEDAAAWIARQVNASGFIPQAANPANPNLSVSAQAVTALAAAGVGRAQVAALLAYLGNHIDDFVAQPGGDDPGALAYLILAAQAGGDDPTSFGPSHTNLVTRLVAGQQASGLFGAADATFDGAFRQGLALLALHAAGVASASGVSWLEDQQCADGAWTSLRADLAVPCPAVDPSTFAGPDTNSTALATLGLHAQGAAAPASEGVTALDAARNAGGGWGFLARDDQATDANSTGLVLEALRTVNGVADGPGLTALLALQVGCAGVAADRGGIAFQPGAGGSLVPDGFATVQATPALAEVALPITSATIAAGVPTPCAASSTTTVSTTSTTVAPTATTVGSAGSTVPAETSTVAAAASAQLPRTGTSSAPMTMIAVGLLAAGALSVVGARRRST
jgi:LPXTG-motif cell wall-anchored protein